MERVLNKKVNTYNSKIIVRKATAETLLIIRHLQEKNGKKGKNLHYILCYRGKIFDWMMRQAIRWALELHPQSPPFKKCLKICEVIARGKVF